MNNTYKVQSLINTSLILCVDPSSSIKVNDLDKNNEKKSHWKYYIKKKLLLLMWYKTNMCSNIFVYLNIYIYSDIKFISYYNNLYYYIIYIIIYILYYLYFVYIILYFWYIFHKY